MKKLILLLLIVGCVTEPEDCAGVAGGTATEDICGVCNGDESSCNVISINDYNFVKDRYFFIDNKFKNSYYPLDENNNHIYNPDYVIGEFELYQRLLSPHIGMIPAEAFLFPEDTTSYSVGGTWVKLEENMDYEIDRILGYIRLNSVQNDIAIAYTTTSFDFDNQTFGAVQDTTNGTTFKSIYHDCMESSTNYQEECGGLITLKLLKDSNHSTPNSPTWSLMFKNVYSLGGSNINANDLKIEIVLNLGNNETTHSDNGNPYSSIFGLLLDRYNDLDGNGIIDIYESIINLTYGELMLPYHFPFAYDETNILGNSHEDLIELLNPISDDSPAMYHSTNQNDIEAETKFSIKIIH